MPEVFQKGRHRKLDADKVHLMKKDRAELNLSYEALAEKYGVSKSTIADIFKGRTWKNVQ
jgi:DNA-binding XRE family transcriptional regulator